MLTRHIRQIVHTALAVCLTISLFGFKVKRVEAAGAERRLTVVTRNMFIGADFGPILGATDFNSFLTAVANAYLHVQQSNILNEQPR